jgi:DNA-binding transcriptional ArsR family regulator
MNMDSCNTITPAYGLFFSTLANENRLKILNVLRTKRLNVTEIVKATEFEQTLVSHHLKTLEHHGMVFVEKQGKYKYYTLNKNTIRPLLVLIDTHMKQYCCKILEGKR